MTCEQRLISVTRGTKELGGRTNKQKIRLFDCFLNQECLLQTAQKISIYRRIGQLEVEVDVEA